MITLKTGRERKWMKAQAWLVIITLLFGQLGVGFLHNRHDFHEKVSFSTTEHGDVLLPHGEHCKVCAIDLFHQFVTNTTWIAQEFLVANTAFVQSTSDYQLLVLFETQGRAPPVA